MRVVLAIVVCIACVGLLVSSCVSRDYQVIETYTETQIKQEPYTVTENVEVRNTKRLPVLNAKESGLPILSQLSGRNLTTMGYLVGPLTLQQGLETGVYVGFSPEKNTLRASYHLYDSLKPNPIAPPDQDLFQDIRTASQVAQDCRLLVSWSVTDGKGLPYGYIIDYGVAEGLAAAYRWPQKPSIEARFSSALAYDKASPGTIRYIFQPARNTQHMWLAFGNLESNAVGPVTLSISASYEWDEVVTTTKQVTKYRDIPVQVEKQRTVTQTKQAPFWDLLFGK